VLPPEKAKSTAEARIRREQRAKPKATTDQHR
jgi:hypothetical protein